jgi:hypothetical protein
MMSSVGSKAALEKWLHLQRPRADHRLILIMVEYGF